MRTRCIAIGLLLPTVVSAQIAVTEVRWAGSAVSSADEWLRIQNISTSPVSLSNWSITTRKSSGDDEVMLTFDARTLQPGQDLLISNYPRAQSALLEDPDVVTSAVSLPNTKLLLQVFDAEGNLVDTVDDGVGTPFAGGKDPFRSMVRIDVHAPGDTKENWQDEGDDKEGNESKESSSSSSSLQSLHSSQSSSVQSSASSTAGITVATSPLPAANSDVSIVGIIPQTLGDRSAQQLTLRYTGGRRATLEGWSIDNRAGGSAPVKLDGITFSANQDRTFRTGWLGISFTPERDTARLIAPDGTVVSMVAWNTPAPWQVVRPVPDSVQKMPVEVVAIESRSSLSVKLLPESFVGVLPRLETYWAHSAHRSLHPAISVTLTGVEVLRGTELPLQVGETIWLDPQSVDWRSWPVVDAYVYLEDGTLLQRHLLSRALATVSATDDHKRSSEFIALNSYFSSDSSSSSSSIEQKIYTKETLVQTTPSVVKRVTPVVVADPRIDSRLTALVEAKKDVSEPIRRPVQTGLPWVLLFGQSVAWLLSSARRLL